MAIVLVERQLFYRSARLRKLDPVPVYVAWRWAAGFLSFVIQVRIAGCRDKTVDSGNIPVIGQEIRQTLSMFRVHEFSVKTIAQVSISCLIFVHSDFNFWIFLTIPPCC